MVRDEDYIKVKIDKLTTPNKNGLFKIMHNFYWAVTADDCVLFYKRTSPQANIDKKIMDRFDYPDFVKKIKLIENVFVPINSNSYEYSI